MRIVMSILNTTLPVGAGYTLPVAVHPDHAGMPVTLPRESDRNMRRDGSDVVRPLQPNDKVQAVDERGRVHGAPELSLVKDLLAAEKFGVDYRTRSERRRCRSSRRTCPRLRGQDKSNDVAAVESAHYYLISHSDCTGCDGTARGALVPLRTPRVSYDTLFSVPAHTSRFIDHAYRAPSLTHSTDQAGKENGYRDWHLLGERSSRVLSRFRDLPRSSRTRRRRGCPGPDF